MSKTKDLKKSKVTGSKRATKVSSARASGSSSSAHTNKVAHTKKNIEQAAELRKDPTLIPSKQFSQASTKMEVRLEQEELALDDVQFIPDFDPKISVEENQANAVNSPGLQGRFLASSVDEVLFSGGRGPLAYGEQVLTQYGFKPIEELSIGDWVVCPDNTKAQIIDIPFDGVDECYEFEFIDGRKVVSGSDHIWKYEIANRSLKPGSLRARLGLTKDLVKHFNSYSRDVKDKRHILLPISSPVEYGHASKTTLPIDPYVLGLLLGDGSLSGDSVRLTTADIEVVHAVAELGYNITTSSIPGHITYGLPGLIGTIRDLGLNVTSEHKFIPKDYLNNASIDDRFSLLQGLMDSDGTTDGSGASYTSVSKQLAKDVQSLIWSLGGKATLTDTGPGSYRSKYTNELVLCKIVYDLYIQMTNNKQLFRLSRKVEKASSTFNGGIHGQPSKLRITGIKAVGIKKCRCITISHPDGLFLTNDFAVTHNSGKSTAFIIDPLRFCHNKNFRGLIIRKAMPDLRDLITRCKALYQQAFPGTKWKEQEKVFTFPSGARMEFGYCDSLDDLERYRGQEYTWVGIDEIAQYPGPWIIDRLKASMRSTDATLPINLRACVDEGEVLTSAGWRPIQDVRENDYVYSPDKDGHTTLKRVNIATKYDVVDEDIVRIHKKNFYASFTKDHRVVKKNFSSNNYEIMRWSDKGTRTSIDMARAGLTYATDAAWSLPKSNFTDKSLFLEFLGLWLADGCVLQKVHNGNYPVIITQLKGTTVDLVKDLFDRVPYTYCHKENGDFTILNKELWTYFKELGQSKTKHVPREILDGASTEELQILLDGLVLGDGHRQSDTSFTYWTVSEQLKDDITEICAKLGYKVMVTLLDRGNPNHSLQYVIYVTMTDPATRIELSNRRNDESLEPYTGSIYCIGVDDNETFIIRQQGSVWVTGNTCNPLGPGRAWVKARWVDKGEPEEIVTRTYETNIGTYGITQTWFHSDIYDNKALLAAQPHYVAALASHTDETVRAQELEGSWDAVDGLAFPEFEGRCPNTKIPLAHIVDDFEIPDNWYRWRAADYGYSSMGVVLWFASDWDNNIYVYRELATTLVNVEDWAIMIKNLEAYENVSRGYLDGSLWSKRGEIGEAPATTMSRIGISWTPADRSPGSRKSSKLLVHKYLALQPETEKPKLRILRGCTELIKELRSLQLDPNDPEDIDRTKKTSLPDHAYDALRYGLQAMPDKHIHAPNDPFLAVTVQDTDSWEPFDQELGL